MSQKDVAIPEEEASLRTVEWKWTQGQLFHLASDALETTDVSGAILRDRRAMSRALGELLKARPKPPDHHVEPDEELLKAPLARLRQVEPKRMSQFWV